MSKEYPSVYKSNTSGHIFQAVLTFLLFTGATWLFIQPIKIDKVSPDTVNIIALILMLLTGIIFAISALRILRPAPELEYLGDGFKFKVGTSTIVFIAWETVEDLSFIKSGEHLLLAVLINNPAEIIRNTSSWAKIVLKARLKNYKTPVLLSSKRLQLGPEELKLAFVQHWNKYRHA